MTDVSVVIVSYESRPLLERCLAALAADAGRTASTEVIVVDQDSQDGTAAWLAAERPEVRLVALPENVGFGAGNNRGAEVATGRWLLLLNSDAFVRPGAIDELVRFAEARPSAGVVGPRLLWPDGRLQRSCRRFPTVSRLATEYLYLRKLAPRSRALNGFYCGDFDHATARRVDWLTGACLLVRRDLFEQLGGFDEAFFLYSEEVDLLYRAAQLGAETWFDPAAEVVHVWGGTRGPRLGADPPGAGAQPRALPRQARLARRGEARSERGAGRPAAACQALERLPRGGALARLPVGRGAARGRSRARAASKVARCSSYR